ncbi:MAG: chromate transporter [Clostridia bacterium]|nr:chromate transporter [Clostridia bacterium]
MGSGVKKIGLLEFFLLFVKIGIFTIGGGYVMIPLLQKEFVEKRKLMDVEEFLNIMALAQCGPGGVAINASTVVGYNIKGYLGALLATVGTVLPSFFAILLLAFYLLEHGSTEHIEQFLSGARPAVVGLLFASAYSLGREAIKDAKGTFIALASLLVLVLFNAHPILVIIAGGILGVLLYFPREGKETKTFKKRD